MWLELVIRFRSREGRLDVLSARKLARPPRAVWPVESPMLVRGKERDGEGQSPRPLPVRGERRPIPGVPKRTRELTVEWLRAADPVGTVQAFPARSYHFLDREEADGRLAANGLAAAREDVRALHLELPDDALWLVFGESALASPGGHAPWAVPGRPGRPEPDAPVLTRTLGSYFLGNGPVPAAPRPDIVAPTPVPWRSLEGGQHKPPVVLRGSGETENAFNVVVLGEGWRPRHAGDVELHADFTARTLAAMLPIPQGVPFNAFHAPLAAAADGIALCDQEPRGQLRLRHCQKLDVHDDHDPWMLDPVRLTDAVSTVAPFGAVDLVVVLANTKVGWGFARRDLKTCVIPCKDDGRFEGRLAHEAGHVLAELCDEAVQAFVRDCQHPQWRNVAARDAVDRGELPWKDLVTEGDLVNGRILREDRVGATVGPDRLRRLGAFAGCAYVSGPCEDEPVRENVPAGDPRWAGYYRPMFTCRMHDVMAPFCRACEEALRRAIGGVTVNA